MSKGSSRRPSQISAEEMRLRWARVFGSHRQQTQLERDLESGLDRARRAVVRDGSAEVFAFSARFNGELIFPQPQPTNPWRRFETWDDYS